MNLVTSRGKENTLRYLFGKVWLYSEGNRHMVVLYWILFIVAMLISLTASPFIWARIMNIATTEGVTDLNIGTLWRLLAYTVLVDLVFWLFHGPARLIEQMNAFFVKVNYRIRLTEGVFTLPLEWHAGHLSGDTTDKIQKGTDALSHFASNSFMLIYNFVQLIVSFAILTYYSGPAAVIIIMMVALSILITVRFDDHLVPLYDETNLLENGISAAVTDAITNITTIIILRVEKLIWKTLSDKMRSPENAVRMNNFICEIKWFLTSISCTLMVALVLGCYFSQHLGVGLVKAGELSLLYQYLRNMCDLFFKFTSTYGEVMQERSRVEGSEKLTADFRQEKITNHVLPRDWKRLEVSDLSFRYQDADTKEPTQHLDTISFSITRGKTTAFVGETGSGKTTALKLIRDLYHPQSLTLCVDGTLIPEGFAGCCRAMTLAPQDPELFAKSIRDNITMGTQCPERTLERFITMACFDSVVLRLPHGLDSKIQEKGVNLSGGEQQRLALARGLLAADEKDIVLLDEPTSSLDPATEMQVYRNIFREFRGKAIISTVHRLHLLPLFDEVVMFERGKIVGTGSVEELLVRSPSFKTLWEAATGATLSTVSA